jgi:PAS domain S-box-containing protein/diguanylate cyclase (GGDEF)-like protein
MHAATNDQGHLASLVQASEDAIMTKSLDGTVLTWNPAATRIFGYAAEEMVGRKMLLLFPPDRVGEEVLILSKLAQGQRIEHFRTQRVCKDGRLIDISVTVSPIHNADGVVVAASKIARDITAQVQAERQIAQYKALIDSSDDGIISKDPQGTIQTWNAGATRIFGYTAEQVVGRHISLLFPPERLSEEDKLLNAVLAGEPVRHFRTTRLTQEGRRIFVSVSLAAIKGPDGRVLGFSKIVRDLTQEIQQEQLLWQEVHFDSLTGTMSRVGIQNAVDDLIRISLVRGRSIALVRCHINGFAQITSRLPAAVAEHLLVQVARALKDAVREADDVARIHADHFVVLLQGFTQVASIPKAVQKIQAAIESITAVDGHPVALSASVGVAVYPEDGKTYATLSKKAEHAMQTARVAGGENAHFFSGLDRGAVPDDFFLVQGLEGAIAANQLHLAYQPIVDAQTGRVVKAEALLRWEHPQLGSVSPAVFIPLAEKYGIVTKLSQWVLRQAMQDLARWTGVLGMGFQVSVNRSSHDFYDFDECLQEMRDGLHAHGLCGSNLVVEVTEYSLIGNPSLTEKILRAYRSLGVGIAMDDFGTGYSSLDYLKRYPVDIIKIDKVFVDALAHSSVDYQLCDGIVSLAKRLGLQVVAEGVETTTQLDILRQMGVEFIQGYVYAKPMRAADLEAFVSGLRAAGSAV